MTPYENIYKRFLANIEKDEDFFNYNNVDIEEAKNIALKRCEGLLDEAVEELKSQCILDIEIDNRDSGLQQFNVDLALSEEELLANIMYYKYFEKDLVKLKVIESWFCKSEFNQISPANERKTFLDMVKYLKEEIRKEIRRYEAKDRLTGKYKGLEYDNL